MSGSDPDGCMLCGEMPKDPTAFEQERRVDHVGKEWWVLWVYCASCDCWTEQAPEGMPEYL